MSERIDNSDRIVVARTCTELPDDANPRSTASATDAWTPRGTGVAKPLSEFRSVPAYVLLGDPGAGKSTEFTRESEALGDNALVLKARDFVTFDVDSHPEWRDKVLFIDGLDEMRAGATDSRVPLDEIRNRLDRLAHPRFRISCREADWLGANDRQSLEKVSPDSQITALRLDPLSDEAIHKLLSSWLADGGAQEGEVQEFIVKAQRRGVAALLDNPLTLRLLVDAVGRGEAWPDSRLETFEMACQKMAEEQNEEHLAGTTQQSMETTMDAAGRLCALMLLSGKEGYLLGPGSDTSSFRSLNAIEDVPGLPRESLKCALASRLFTGGDETRAPHHRQVAEFLGGRYLAKQIRDGLPARRVVALMVGPSDSGVVSALRGLSAWLAAHSREAHAQLIDADPIGVGLYGDITAFTPSDKERLLRSLTTFASLMRISGGDGILYDTAWAFRSLASPDMASHIKGLLNVQRTEDPDDRIVMFLLEVLSVAEESALESLADLVPDLEAILRDTAWSSEVRKAALRAYVHVVRQSDVKTHKLTGFLGAICDGTLPDPDDGLRAILLTSLYPTELQPAQVWRHVLSRNRHSVGGRYWQFWNDTLLEQSSDQHVAELLDAFHDDASNLAPALQDTGMANLPLQLLVRGLEVFGESLEPSRLYDWLDSTGSSRPVAPGSWGSSSGVRGWLEARPDVQRAVFLVWLRRRNPDDPDWEYGYRHCDALHKTKLPADFERWCFEKAVEIGDTEPTVTEVLLRHACLSRQELLIDHGLTLEVMRERVRGQRTLERQLDELCKRRSPSTASVEDAHSRWIDEAAEQHREEERQRREDWAKLIRPQEDELRENRVQPQILDTLAQESLGLFTDSDQEESPSGRISDFIGEDQSLVDAVMVALRGAVWRDDVPEVDLTISLRSESNRSWLAYPVLASLELLHGDDPEQSDRLDDAQKRKALAIHFCTPLGYNVRPDWYDRWLQQYPDLVLDVLSRCAVAAARKGEEFTPALNELDGVTGHDGAVHEVRLRLLKAFPVRGSKNQLRLFDRLLKRAFEYPEKNLETLVKQKLGLKSMNVAQRVRWLAVDALMSQGSQLRQLKAYVGESEIRVRHLADFLRHSPDSHVHRRAILTDGRELATLRALIGILGCSFGPRRPDGLVTLEIAASELIYSLIGQFGSQGSDEAGQALTDLINDPRLERWHEYLTYVREGQSVVHRDASYRHPGIEKVQRTLNNDLPANAADLAALLSDRVNDVSENVRGGNSNLWRQFWNEGSHGRLTDPKSENSCRDVLLASLQTRLPPEVDALPEGQYAADKRADIRVSYGGFNIPVEIKKNSARDLWSALRRQLIEQYTTDPATSGHGVFLVLWFGDNKENRTTPPPDGKRPTTPEELQQRLEKDLTLDEARKIDVIVLDVTKPADQP